MKILLKAKQAIMDRIFDQQVKNILENPPIFPFEMESWKRLKELLNKE